MPSVQQGLFISDPAQIATDAVGAAEIAANSVGDSEVAAHTTTKITVPFSLVTGTVPIAQGGTGQTAQTAAFDALAPTTTQGDIIFHNGTDNIRLGPGTNGQFLQTQGAGANPQWANATAEPAWTLIETLTWAASSADQSFATFTARDMLMLIINGTSVRSLTLTASGVSANTYDYTTIQEAAVATTADAASWVLSSGDTDVSNYQAVYYITGRQSSGTARVGLHGTAHLTRNQAIAVLNRGSAAATTDVTALTIGVGGNIVTMKAKLYGLNL